MPSRPMPITEGRFRRVHGGFPHCGIVELSVEPSDSPTDISVQCSGAGWIRQGSLEDASADGYDDWKRGAVRGVEFALTVADQRAVVVIRRITGMITDTNPSIVAGAAALAIWDALEFTSDETVITTMESVVFRGWKRDNSDIPTVNELLCRTTI